MKNMRAGRDREVLGGAAEAREQVVVVGIDDRRAVRDIGQDHDPVGLHAKSPGLGVVAARRERRVPDQIAELGRLAERRPRPRDRSLVVGPRSHAAQREPRRAADHGSCRADADDHASSINRHPQASSHLQCEPTYG